jgi:hypothetical protein
LFSRIALSSQSGISELDRTPAKAWTELGAIERKRTARQTLKNVMFGGDYPVNLQLVAVG